MKGSKLISLPLTLILFLSLGVWTKPHLLCGAGHNSTITAEAAPGYHYAAPCTRCGLLRPAFTASPFEHDIALTVVCFDWHWVLTK